MMKRYDSYVENLGCGDFIPDMRESKDGEYVLYSDVSALIKDVDTYRQMYEQTTQTNADLRTRLKELECKLLGVLLVVPDGESCKEKDTACTFIQVNGEVLIEEGRVWGWMTLDGNYALVDDETIVQPVRIVPFVSGNG